MAARVGSERKVEMAKSTAALLACGCLLLPPLAPDAQARGSAGAGPSSEERNLVSGRLRMPIEHRSESGPWPSTHWIATSAPSVEPGTLLRARTPLLPRRTVSPVPDLTFVPNPLASSSIPASPEFRYLFTIGPIARETPPLRLYAYRADNTYLLTARGVHRGTAWSYQWRRPPAHQTAVQAVRSASPTVLGTPSAPARSIEDALGARALVREQGQGWRNAPRLGAGIPWRGAGPVSAAP